MSIRRGAFIVFEGCDKSGKSTQCQKLIERLNKSGFQAQKIQFPERSTATGKILDSYLANKEELSDQAVHLLFAANRWERESKMRQLLHEGVTLVADRYSFSGVAYSAAKPGLTVSWCQQPETGLPRPDIVFLLSFISGSNDERSGFGEERYEKREFQELVYKNYLEMKDSTWKIIESDKSIEEIHEMIWAHCLEAIEKSQTNELKTLW